MYNKTVLDWFVDTKDDVVDFSKSRMYEIITSVVFLVLITQGRKVWMNALHLFSLFDGLFAVTMTERYLGGWVSGQLDESHIVLAQYVGILEVCWCLGYFFSNRSTDATLETSYLLTYFIMAVMGLMTVGYLMSHPAKKSATVKFGTEGINLMFYMCLLMAVGTLFHLFRSKDWGGYGEVSSHANLHLRIDFVILMVMGIMDFALPQWTIRMSLDIEKVDTVHAMFTRTAGAMLIGMGLMSARAANFLRASDKDAVVVSHWLYYVLISIYTWYMCYTWRADLTWAKIAIKAVHDTIVILNATGALDRDISVFKRVVIHRFKVIPQEIKGFFKYKRF